MVRPTLSYGSRGEAVKELQQILNLYPDGIFGRLTKESVKTFQEEHGLTVDGVVGPLTWAALTTSDGPIKKSARAIKEIIIHCTASREGQDYTVAQIRQMHTAPKSQGGSGWSDIGYHYVIYRDGKILPGRDVNISGAHCLGHNAHSIGIVYVGGLSKDGKVPKDTRTPQQRESLKNLVKQLMSLYGLGPESIHGHNEFAAKACPCFDVRRESFL